MTIDFKKKEYIPYYVIACISLAAIIFSLIVYGVNFPGKRRTFVFPSADSGKYIVEYRYLPRKPVQGDINLYVDEILLGSGVERTKMLFSLGTKVESCFLRDGILYLNLSGELLQMGNGVIDIKDGVELLKENIQNNFHKVKRIEIFVDGKYAFESN